MLKQNIGIQDYSIMDTGAVHSTAQNFLSSIEAGVDPRTGLYSASISLPVGEGNCLRGPGSVVSLSFSALNNRNTGFGVGWGLSVTSLDLSANLLQLSSGERFRIDPWTQGEECTFPDRKLDSFSLIVENPYRAVISHYSSGIIEILEAPDGGSRLVTTNLIGTDGSSIFMEWQSFGTDDIRLISIYDDNKTALLNVDYDFVSSLTLHPNTSYATQMLFHCENERLVRISLPTLQAYNAYQVKAHEEAEWNFTYETTSSPSLLLLNSVTQPFGAHERVQYDESAMTLPSGAPRSTMPAVILRTLWEDDSLNRKVHESQFQYNLNGNSNYYGYPAISNWRDSEDNLLHWTGREDFIYGSTETLYDSDDNPLCITERQYNRFHLITRETSSYTDYVHEVLTTYHDDVTQPFEAQLPYCQLPRTVMTRQWMTSAPETVLITEVTTTYDEYGNLKTRYDSASGQTEAREYYPPAGASCPAGTELCPPDPHGKVHRLKSLTLMPDERGGPVRQTNYVYTRVPLREGIQQRTGYAHKTEYYIQASGETVWATENGTTRLIEENKQYFYTDGGEQHGSLLEERSTRNGHTAKREYRYVLDRVAGELNTYTNLTTHDAICVTTSETRQLQTGLTLSTVGLNNTETRISYDALGRKVSINSMPGTEFEAITSWKYQMQKGEAWQQTTDPTGLVYYTRFDSLGRPVVLEAPGHDGVPVIVKTSEYNSLGQVIAETEVDPGMPGIDPLHLKTSYEYNSLGEIRREIRPDGVCAVQETEFTLKNGQVVVSTLAWLEDPNGEETAYTLTEKSADGTTLRTERGKRDCKRLRHPANEMSWTYDGLGRCLSLTDACGQITLQRWDDEDRLIESVLPDKTLVKRSYPPHLSGDCPEAIYVQHASLGSEPVMLGRRVYDGLGRVLTEEVGGSVSYNIYEDVQMSPASTIRADGSELKMVWESALGEAPLTLSSGNDNQPYVENQYHPLTGRLIKTQTSGGAVKLTYDLLGNVMHADHAIIGDQKRQVTQTVTPGGRLMQIKAQDGVTTTYLYDQLGRLVSQKDTDVEVNLFYDSLGREKERTVISADNGNRITTFTAYDEFGRPAQQTWVISTLAGDTTRSVFFMYRADNKLVSKRLEDSAGNILREETMEYDMRGRLVCHSILAFDDAEWPQDEQGSLYQKQEFVYDALDNLLTVTTEFLDNTVNVTTYGYDSADPVKLICVENSRTGYPGHNSPLILRYDEEGNVTNDGDGLNFYYDNLGLLSRIQSDDETQCTEYEYGPDGKACRVTEGDSHVYRYYKDGKLRSEMRGDKSTRFIRCGEMTIGESFMVDAENELHTEE
ncbi:TPA: RHS repeat protein [Enterobacter ludwigii]|nr:RHS repeat protein [Enterobacter ludwigii]